MVTHVLASESIDLRSTSDQATRRTAVPGSTCSFRTCWVSSLAMSASAERTRLGQSNLPMRLHNRYMSRIIGTVLGAIFAIWLAVTVAGGIIATVKTFVIIGLIAAAVIIVVWLVARRPHRG